MVKVLIIGAPGYIGFATALNLRKHNHRVYGLARTPEKAKKLTEHEIIAIEGSVEDSASYVKAVEENEIDVIIDIAGSPFFPGSTKKILTDLKPAAEARLKKYAHGPANKIGYIYCSGLWVHGDSVDPVADSQLVGTDRATTNPPKLVEWRPSVEDEVLAATDLFEPIIVRPGLLYGGISPIWGLIWGPILAALKSDSPTAVIPLEEDTIIPTVHLDDVAEGFRAAVENLPVLAKAYPIYNITTGFEPASYINKLVARSIGFKGKLEYKVPEGDNGLFPRAFSTTVNTNASRFTSLTGWKPSKYSFLADADLYAKAWKSANE